MIQHVYAQQWEMYRNKSRRCEDRIVSISQPYVRPIVRGKLDKQVEFGAKLSMRLKGDGVACVDHLRWDAFHEDGDLESQVEDRTCHDHYPEAVLGDPVYGTQVNRKALKRLKAQLRASNTCSTFRLKASLVKARTAITSITFG